MPIYGSRQCEKLGQAETGRADQHLSSWQFSQFLHGEQGAMICSARIVGAVPDMDSKFYAAHPDDGRGPARRDVRPVPAGEGRAGLPDQPASGQTLLADALSDSRWDMPYLGMQVLIEGLALAAFGVHPRHSTTNPLPKQILAYVMQDEARHVAFGRLALRDDYARAHRGGARRARGVRGRGLLPDARPVRAARRCGRGSASTSRSASSSPTARPTQQMFRHVAVQPHRALREGHRPVGAEGAAGLRRHRRARHGRRRPRPRS